MGREGRRKLEGRGGRSVQGEMEEGRWKSGGGREVGKGEGKRKGEEGERGERGKERKVERERKGGERGRERKRGRERERDIWCCQKAPLSRLFKPVQDPLPPPALGQDGGHPASCEDWSCPLQVLPVSRGTG